MAFVLSGKAGGYLAVGFGLLLGGCNVVVDDNGPPPGAGGGMCTREYAPVCAQRDGERDTFANGCEARSSGYRIVYDGECRGRGRDGRGRDRDWDGDYSRPVSDGGWSDPSDPRDQDWRDRDRPRDWRGRPDRDGPRRPGRDWPDERDPRGTIVRPLPANNPGAGQPQRPPSGGQAQRPPRGGDRPVRPIPPKAQPAAPVKPQPAAPVKPPKAAPADQSGNSKNLPAICAANPALPQCKPKKWTPR